MKEWVSISERSYYSFVYYPSKKYSERRWTRPKKRVKDWALIDNLRPYSTSKENPIVGPSL